MIILFGAPVSNFYNKVKLALLEKELDFQEELTGPSQEEAVTSKSPMGKIPFIKDGDQYIYESTAIVEYLDHRYPERPLIPADPVAAARVRAVSQIVEQYLDIPARRLLAMAFFGAERDEKVIEAVEAELTHRLQGVARAVNFKPFAAGESFSLADLSVLMCFPTVTSILKSLDRADLMADFPGYAEYQQRMLERPKVSEVFASWRAATEQLNK